MSISLQKIPPIIHALELREIMHAPDLIVIDASNRPEARENYENKHIDGALFIDVNEQLSYKTQDTSNGGRHPLPSIESFIETMHVLGISHKNRVVIYDDKNGVNAAARFWWMLKAAGHKHVQVLNGGIQHAEKSEVPMNNLPVIPNSAKRINVDSWLLPIVNLQQVEKHSSEKSACIIDVRTQDRYLGLREPIDLIAGHIPNAINIPFSSNLDEDGLFLSPNQLKAIYDKRLSQEKTTNIIVHCGSGVTACSTLLAMDYAGMDIPKLYVGSWSEWSRNGMPIFTDIE